MFPRSASDQLERLSSALKSLLGRNLLGLYLHGSLAMGSFSSSGSDLDLLAVTSLPLDTHERPHLAALLMAHSGVPHPLEISFLHNAQLRLWRFPTPYDFHFSESWREKYSTALAGGSWLPDGPEENTDEDLAGHFTVLHERGLVLFGPPVEQLFPPVPRCDFVRSIMADMNWAAEGADENPVYQVLNLCRTLACLREGRVFSKAEGVEWSLAHLPERFHGGVVAAWGASQAGQHQTDFPVGFMGEAVPWLVQTVKDEAALILQS